MKLKLTGQEIYMVEKAMIDAMTKHAKKGNAHGNLSDRNGCSWNFIMANKYDKIIDKIEAWKTKKGY
tara:strand:- start:1632 stop:1832 length:201 start_codon:yes stop_codon:yes gene_type:complete